jgi:hypothetical protein
MRAFEVNDPVYLFNPARKSGVAYKFRKPWTRPFKIVRRISDLNYQIVSNNGKLSAVHVIRLNTCVNPEAFRPQDKTNTKRRVTFGKLTVIPDEEEEGYIRGPLIPLNPAEVVEPQVENLNRNQPATEPASLDASTISDSMLWTHRMEQMTRSLILPGILQTLL